MTLTRGTITIETDHCKGCELCIPACRPGVLVMSQALNESGYRFPLLLEGCTACQACHAVCPDFVIDVYKYDTPIWSGDPDARPPDAQQMNAAQPVDAGQGQL